MPKSAKKNGTKDPAPPTQDHNSSPPSMTMRSGRKKQDDDSVSTRASRTSRRSSASASASVTTRSSRRKRKAADGGDDIPTEIQSVKRKKKLEVVDEDEVMEGAVQKSVRKSSRKTTVTRQSQHAEDDVSDLETETKDDETKEDVPMDERTMDDDDGEKKRITDGDNGKGGDANQTQAQVAIAPMEDANETTAAAPMKPSPPPVGTSTLQRLAQGLRLPSQHTPKVPTSLVEGTTPAPPGGRRLFFETAKKKKTENKLLLNLREQAGIVGRDEVEEDVDSPPGLERSPLQFDSGADQNDAISYFGLWLVVLLSFFIVMNVTGLNLFAQWNVRYNASLKSTIDNITTTEIATEPEVIENIVQVVHPSRLSDMKNKMQKQRREKYELNKVNDAIEQTQMDLDEINKLTRQLSAKYPELKSMLASGSLDPALIATDAPDTSSQLQSLLASTADKQSLISEWEEVLKIAESNMDKLVQGEIDHAQMNSVLAKLSRSSLVPATARILDTSKVSIPHESCAGKDYTHTAMKQVQKDEKIDVVGGIDIEALDNAIDAPVRSEDAHAAFKSLMKYAQSSADSLIGQGPSQQVKNWVRYEIDGEWKKKGLNKPLEPPLVAPKKQTVSADGDAYTKLDALNDIDRLLEVELADRTGEFDHATVVHGARVLHRGPYATSPSLYETLPLLNRILAYTKLRFYGHPPEVALLPSPAFARGQCWSFTEEKNKSTNGEIRGEYATLTIGLDAPTFVTEVVLEHRPSADMSSALREFRVLGFEDGGAFGEPYELGSFQYNTAGKFSLQRFSIPTTVNGASVPKLKAISLAVDSNWGADFTCLYRFRVHGQ